MLQTLLDCVFPRRSLTGEGGAWITADERMQLQSQPPVFEERGLLRHQGIEHLDRLYAACRYHEAPLLRSALWRFKYHSTQAFAGELAELLLANAPEPHPAESVLCPVPLHWTRRFQRGFNQAELLAGALAQGRGLPVQSLLARVHATGHQARRNRTDRRNAIRIEAFRAMGPVPPHVILIDDVATTGATLDACAAVLKAAGAVQVEAWVLARG